MDKHQIEEYAKYCLEFNETMDSLIGEYKNSTGEVKDAYKTIMLEKCWKMCRTSGIFYHGVLGAMTELEMMIQHSALAFHPPPSSNPAADPRSVPSQ